jgi:hypothetical protein
VPCYYATENCDDYQVGLLGLESDLDPESPGNPIRDLAIIFEAGSDITNKTVIDLGVEADYAGTLITQGGTPPNCEKGDHYNLEHFKITQKYNKGKNLKIRLRVSVSFANVNFTPTDLCLLYAENQKQKCLKGNHQDLVGSFSPPKSFEGRTIVTTVVTTPKSTKESNHWGMLFESDWYSIKKHHSIYATSCNTNMLLKGRMKNHNELYAAFYFLGDWCNGDTYRFINQPGHGDQNSWVDIQNSSSYNLNEY